MKTSVRFRVLTLTTVVLEGRRYLPRSEVSLTAPEAATLVRQGQARLVDPADLGPLADAAASSWRGCQTR
jgi:hypothetical protein